MKDALTEYLITIQNLKEFFWSNLKVNQFIENQLIEQLFFKIPVCQ